MKILYYHKEYQTPMYLWQRVHIIDELAHHGIQVEMLNPLDYETLEQANETLLKEAATAQYDLFMTPHNEEELFLDTLQQIKHLGIPTMLICFDNLVAPYLHRNIAAQFDLVWLTAPENREMFTRWGAKTIMLPYAANPYAFSFQPQPEILRAAFIGTPYGSRVNMINCLLEQNVPVTLYGNTGKGNGGADNGSDGFSNLNSYVSVIKEYVTFPTGRKLMLAAAMQRMNPAASLLTDSTALESKDPVLPQELPTLYAAYALSLSSSTARNTGILKHPVHIVNLRAFEIPMCGGIQICRYNPELSNYFEDDKEILFYHSNEEMTDKAKFYLAPEREAQRKAIRQAARKRAEGEHTWYHRFSKAFEALDLRHP